MFDKLFGPRVSSVEPDVERAVEEEESDPRYTVELEATYERSSPYGGRKWYGRYTIYDRRQGGRKLRGNGVYASTEEHALSAAESLARRWVEDQHIIDKGPTQRTFTI